MEEGRLVFGPAPEDTPLLALLGWSTIRECAVLKTYKGEWLIINHDNQIENSFPDDDAFFAFAEEIARKEIEKDKVAFFQRFSGIPALITSEVAELMAEQVLVRANNLERVNARGLE